jgi:hypothetical protein
MSCLSGFACFADVPSCSAPSAAVVSWHMHSQHCFVSGINSDFELDREVSIKSFLQYGSGTSAYN